MGQSASVTGENRPDSARVQRQRARLSRSFGSGAPRHSRRARSAVRGAAGDTTFELLVAYLAFVRTAHFWTEMHPELAFEADCASMLAEHGRLAELVLGPSEADLVRGGDEIKKVIATIEG